MDTLTQQVIADMLGVRREGVTDGIGALEREGLIHCRRGCIVPWDRPGLEARACECYAALKEDYGHLLADSRPGAVAAIPRFPLPVLA